MVLVLVNSCLVCFCGFFPATHCTAWHQETVKLSQFGAQEDGVILAKSGVNDARL